MKHCGIYLLESPIGEVYIGQSRNIKSRISVYRRCKNMTQPKLYESLKKHGYENHKVSVLAHLPTNVSQDALDVSEKAYISLYKKAGRKMLNISKGGGAPMYGKTHSEKTRLEQSKRYSGVNNPNYGKGCFGNTNGRSRVILQYDIDGNFIREWDTVTNASKELGIKRTTISSNLIGLNKSAKGFIWKYKTNKL